ncbi:hypothetical protein [Mycolicibacterium llatzerense]|uniref:hypothetical protein n=1 Tax=Mycolicibacterium llatzerense TaxID=280871 RepID=UPI0013A6BE01|nr:hypothetical protein [Mycolicibacterium llatzerense]
MSVAAKINRLFDVMHRWGEPAMTTEAAAAGISARVPITATYLDRLRAGADLNPTTSELTAIAEFFGVSAAYLLSDRPDIEDQLTLLETMRDAPRVFNCRRLGGQ